MITELVTAAFTMPLPWASEDDGGALWLIGPGAGIAFYVFYYLRYRNTHKRHAFERETNTVVDNVTGQDLFMKRVSGVENPKVPGENSSAPRQRLGQNSHFAEE